MGRLIGKDEYDGSPWPEQLLHDPYDQKAEYWWVSCEDWCSAYTEKGGDCSNCILQQIYSKLADYEDAEEQGRIIVLPYKIGATLYETAVHCENPENLICNHSSDCFKCEDAEMFICECKISTIDQAVFLMRDFGKTLFATPEEAEAKLKEMEVDNHGDS